MRVPCVCVCVCVRFVLSGGETTNDLKLILLILNQVSHKFNYCIFLGAKAKIIHYYFHIWRAEATHCKNKFNLMKILAMPFEISIYFSLDGKSGKCHH